MDSYYYAFDVLKGSFEKGEDIISKDARYSYCYARFVLKGRFEKGEDIISKDARYSYYYARDVLKGRFEKGEDIISKNAEYSYIYALDILKGRFEKGESAISKDDRYSKLYKINVYDPTKQLNSPNCIACPNVLVQLDIQPQYNKIIGCKLINDCLWNKKGNAACPIKKTCLHSDELSMATRKANIAETALLNRALIETNGYTAEAYQLRDKWLHDAETNII